jgi:tetratricopeptide (TPR) repeat protein
LAAYIWNSIDSMRRSLSYGELSKSGKPHCRPNIRPLRALLYLGATQRDAGHYEEAASTLQQAVATSRATYPSNERRIAEALEAFAAVLTTPNKPADAAPIQGEALRIRAFLQYKSPSSVPPPKTDVRPEARVASPVPPITDVLLI